MDSTCFIISVCLTFIYFADCGIFYFKTKPVLYVSSDYFFLGRHGYTPQGTSLDFQIKCCSSAYIYLMSSSFNVYYQIVVQGWGNSRSEIHRGSSFSNIKGIHSEPGLLDCNNYKKFRITWNNKEINLDKSVSCLWINMISVSRDASIKESDIKELAVKTSTYSTNAPGHWKFPTTDDTIVTYLEALSSWNYLSQLGYDLGTSTAMSLNLTTCSTVDIGLFKNDSSSDLLSQFAITNIGGIVTSDQGISVPLPGNTLPCINPRTFVMRWSGSTVQLNYTGSSVSLVAEAPQTDLDIKSIGFKASSDATLIWSINNIGACFAEDLSCDPLLCTNQPTTLAAAATTTQSTTAVQPITSGTPSTTSNVESDTTVTAQPTMTPSSTVTSYVSTSAGILLHTTEDPIQTTGTLAFTTSQIPRNNTCCCITYAQLLIADADLLPTLIAKKETNLYKRSLTSAYDSRPSAAFVGYTGSLFLILMAIGLVIVDLPNLIKMVQIMKDNIRIARMQRKKSIQIQPN